MARTGALTVRGAAGKKRRLSGKGLRKFAMELQSAAQWDKDVGDDLSFVGELVDLLRICEHLHLATGEPLSGLVEFTYVRDLLR